MTLEHLKIHGTEIAVVSGNEPLIADAQSALDFAMTVRYESGASKIALPKELLAEDFFILSTSMAGEILQKWAVYQVKAAVWGDYSGYTSEPLKAFIRESNRGHDFFFVSTKEEAVQRLSEPSAAGS